jgi:HEAT repeats
MRHRFATGMALTVLVGTWGIPVQGQVLERERERDVTITGPGGRTIERQIRSDHGAGVAGREVDIQRPGATLHRELRVQQPPRYVGAGGGFFPRPSWGRGGPRGIVERDVIINRGPGWGPALAIGGGLFGLGLFAGSALAPRPPVVLAPTPVYVSPPPPVVVYNPPRPFSTAPPQGTVIVDPVADAMGRLRSTHDNSRRDGALTLGRLRDARAVPALIDRLKEDYSKEVRIASAWALAEIGDPNAGVALERAALFDKRKEVRDAATEAYNRLPHELSGAPSTEAPAQNAAPRTVLGPNPDQRAPQLSPFSYPSNPPPPPEPAEPPFNTGPSYPR